MGGGLLLWSIGLVWFNLVVNRYDTQLKPQEDMNTVSENARMLDDYGKNDFVPFKPYKTDKDMKIRPIALYLPQFHQFNENNQWHGRGFTEWTNVTTAKPLYDGHYQPKLPIDVGFYDLTHEDVMFRQIELAKNYGIYGFAFYYYWFSGKKLMEKPIYNYLHNKNLDFPFCLHWANESWSKRWDGGNQELLMEQNFSEADFQKFAEDLLPFFTDKRYIRVNGKPLFIIYRPALFGQEKFVRFTEYLRDYMRRNGVGELFLLGTKQFGFFADPETYGLDGVIDFDIRSVIGLHKKSVAKYYKDTDFTVWNWKDYIEADLMKLDYTYKTFRTVFPRWDNSPRKAKTGAFIYDGSTPDIYGRWLSYATEMTKRDFKGDERMLFINAWNEWAEGAMLEPDRRYGYAYLDMTRRVLDGAIDFKPVKRNKVGVVALTGGSNRIARAIELLNFGYGEKMLISGVRPGTTMNLITAREDIKHYQGQKVDLGYTAKDTVGNAQEIAEWVEKHDINEIYAVTSFYHIPRSRLELEHRMPTIKIHFVAVESDFIAPKWWTKWKSLRFLAGEYTKFLIVGIQYLPERVYRFLMRN